jgi:hypothetical protein
VPETPGAREIVAGRGAVGERARRVWWLVLALLCAAGPAGAGVFAGSGAGPRGPWVDDVTLTPAERREFDERRAAVQARADDWADRTGTCLDFRSRVRDDLAGVQHVRSVEVGFVLLTSKPPRIPVSFAITLDSGRVVWDRLTVTVPMRPRVVLLDAPVGGVAVSACDPASR